MYAVKVYKDLGLSMNYYSRSSLAYDFTIFEEDEESRIKAEKRAEKRAEEKAAQGESDLKQNNGESVRGRRGVKKLSRRKSNIGRIIAAVVFGLAIAFVVVSIIHGQVQLTELNQQIANAKSELAEQQSVYTQLEMKVDSSISTAVVEEYAKDKLKMSKAANSQKEFVNLSEGDKAEVSMTSDKSIFEAIADAFASLWS